MMAVIHTYLTCDLQKLLKVQYLDGNLFSQDNQANEFHVTVTDNGEPATISGSVTADVIRSDGGTVAVTGGTISGNVASITFPAAVYAVPGVVSIVVKLTTSGVVTTIAAAVANVYQSSTETAVDPGTIIPSIQTLISSIEAAVASIPADYSALWTSLAPAFSSSASYVAGQYCTYNGGVYRFNTSHSGSWAAGDVTAVNIGGELTALKSTLSGVTINIWDEQWANGGINTQGVKDTQNTIMSPTYTEVSASTQYYAKTPSGTSIRIAQYDSSKAFLGFLGYFQNAVFTTGASTKYIRFYLSGTHSTYDHNISINRTIGKYKMYYPHVTAVDYTARKTEFVTPGMFGAVGDGVTDDTAAFTACIGTEMPIFLENKSYAISSGLSVAQPIFGGTIKPTANMTSVVSTSSDVKDVVIDGDTSLDIKSGITLTNFRNSIVEKCKVTKIYNQSDSAIGILVVPAYDNSTYSIRQCIVDDIYSKPNGTVGDDAGSASGISVYSTVISSGEISKCDIKNILSGSPDNDGVGVRGIVSTSVGKSHRSKVLVQNNVFSNIPDDNVKMSMSGIVQNNIFNLDYDADHSSTYGVRILFDEVMVCDNVMHGTHQTTCVYIPNSGILNSAIRNCTISHNRFTSKSDNMIFIESANNSLIGNTIISSKADGISVYVTASCLIESNILQSYNADSLLKANTTCTIINNVTDGYIAAYNFTGGRIANNKCKEIRGTNNNLCVINNNLTGAITFSYGCTNLTVTDNIITNPVNLTGIYLNDKYHSSLSNTLVKGNRITGSVQNGIYASKAVNIVFEDNLINSTSRTILCELTDEESVTLIRNTELGSGTVVISN